MKKDFRLPSDEIEVKEGELIMVHGGGTTSSKDVGGGCGAGSGCGCGCGAGCGCGCGC